MTKTIHVGNLPFQATEKEIKELFARHGVVRSVKLVTDRDNGRPSGYGFVKMDAEAAAGAIAALNGTQFGGRSLRVSEAQERGRTGPRDRPPRREY